MQGPQLAVAALLADSLALLAAGVEDYRRLEVPDYMYYPLLAAPFAAYALAPGLARAALLAMAAAALAALSLARRAGKVASGDALAFARVPAMAYLGALALPSAAAFAAGYLAAVAATYAARLRGLLCGGGLPLGGARVRRERYMDRYVFPPGAGLEDDWGAIEERKRALLESSGGECLEARLGLPFVFFFSLGYLAAAAAAFAASALA